MWTKTIFRSKFSGIHRYTFSVVVTPSIHITIKIQFRTQLEKKKIKRKRKERNIQRGKFSDVVLLLA